MTSGLRPHPIGRITLIGVSPSTLPGAQEANVGAHMSMLCHYCHTSVCSFDREEEAGQAPLEPQAPEEKQ